MRRAEARNRLVQLIEARGPGQSLPPERALSATLGVSRPTLRAALEDLAQEGLVIRQQGRGTFTGTAAIDESLTAAENGPFRAPPVPGTGWLRRLVSFAVEPAGARLGQRMDLSPGADLVSVALVLVADDVPMCIERTRIPARLVPGITGPDFEGDSIYLLLQSRFGVVPATAVQTTEGTVIDTLEAELLSTRVLSPALLFDRLTRDADDQVIEYTTSIYRGDRYRITNTLVFEPGDPTGRPLLSTPVPPRN
jgi:GntR family transcriptional regulator